MAYNRYQGNSGRVTRIRDGGGEAFGIPPKGGVQGGVQGKKSEKTAGFPQNKQPPMPASKKLGGISGLLHKLSVVDLETEDLLLLLILYLLYRESGDEELLMMMGAMFLL